MPPSAKHAQHQPVDLDRVLQTASSLFANFGFEGVGTRDIAKGSGCHVPSLYYHFDSKEKLYRETFGERWEDMVAAIDLALAEASGAQAKLRAFIDTFFDTFARDRELLVLLMRDVINAAVAPPLYLSGRGHRYLLGRLVDVLADIEGRPVETRQAFTLMSLIFGYCCGLQLGAPDDEAAMHKQHLYNSALMLLGR